MRAVSPRTSKPERLILGAILLDNFAFNQRRNIFARKISRSILTGVSIPAWFDLRESSRPIDMITLVEELDRRKNSRPSETSVISGLVDGVPDRPSIEHYIKIVRDTALLED